jgi:hypothetical protein
MRCPFLFLCVGKMPVFAAGITVVRWKSKADVPCDI